MTEATCTSTDPTNHQGDTCPVHEQEATPRPLAGAWWQDPNDNRIHDAEGNDVLDHMTVTEIGRRVNSHDALVAEATELLKNTTWDEDSVGYARVLTQDIEALNAALEQVK